MKTTARRSAVLAGLALTLAWAGIAPAAVANPTNEPARSDKPHTVHVAGRQIPVDVANGLWEMRGALVGEWHAVPTTVLHSDPNRPTLYPTPASRFSPAASTAVQGTASAPPVTIAANCMQPS